MVEEEAFGIIPLRQESAAWQVLLVLHKQGNHWAFPKGRKNGGEEPLQAAKRELKEEVGLEVVKVLQAEPLIDSYQFQRGGAAVKKTVYYFLATVSGEVALQRDEITEAQWVLLKEASRHVTFDEAKQLCARVVELLGG